MKILAFCVFLGTLTAIVQAEGIELGRDKVAEDSLTVRPHTPTTTGSPPPTPETTTKAIVTSTSKPNTSTTSAKPTTTVQPTTTPEPTSTHVPTTTSAPSTSERPTDKPAPDHDKPEVGFWTVKYPNSNESCLLVKAAIQLVVNYNTTKNETRTAYLNIPKNATASGSCKDQVQLMNLTWLSNNSFTLRFTKDAKKYHIAEMDVLVLVDVGNGTRVPFNLTHDQEQFSTSLSRSYTCTKEQSLDLMNERNVTVGSVHVDHVQLEAFHNTTKNDFSEAEDCSPSGGTSDVVPIAVGLALAGLVVVVLVAYLIGRRRSQARGYLSM